MSHQARRPLTATTSGRTGIATHVSAAAPPPHPTRLSARHLERLAELLRDGLDTLSLTHHHPHGAAAKRPTSASAHRRPMTATTGPDPGDPRLLSTVQRLERDYFSFINRAKSQQQAFPLGGDARPGTFHSMSPSRGDAEGSVASSGGSRDRGVTDVGGRDVEPPARPSRPTTASRSRPTTASRTRPTTAGNARLPPKPSDSRPGSANARQGGDGDLPPPSPHPPHTAASHQTSEHPTPSPPPPPVTLTSQHTLGTAPVLGARPPSAHRDFFTAFDQRGLDKFIQAEKMKRFAVRRRMEEVRAASLKTYGVARLPSAAEYLAELNPKSILAVSMRS